MHLCPFSARGRFCATRAVRDKRGGALRPTRSPVNGVGEDFTPGPPIQSPAFFPLSALSLLPQKYRLSTCGSHVTPLLFHRFLLWYLILTPYLCRTACTTKRDSRLTSLLSPDPCFCLPPHPLFVLFLPPQRSRRVAGPPRRRPRTRRSGGGLRGR